MQVIDVVVLSDRVRTLLFLVSMNLVLGIVFTPNQTILTHKHDLKRIRSSNHRFVIWFLGVSYCWALFTAKVKVYKLDHVLSTLFLLLITYIRVHTKLELLYSGKYIMRGVVNCQLNHSFSQYVLWNTRSSRKKYCYMITGSSILCWE